MIVTLAGHVDHGKTALVKALTGVDTDRLEEEKRRGLTIDLGFAYHNFSGHRVGFVDVPGHHRFIHNMIAGVATMQHALLVVAADDGVMPQTREHLNILQLLGLSQGTVVLNKVDLVDRPRAEVAQDQVTELVSSSFLKGCRIIEASAISGEGIDQIRLALSEVAAGFQRQVRKRSARVAIDRSFAPRGVGAVVTGTVFDGQVQVGDELVVTHSSKPVRVRNLVTNGLDSAIAKSGDRCGIQLSGVSVADIPRGSWLRASSNVYRTQHATINLEVLNDFPRRVRNWSSVHVYHATSHHQARMIPLAASLAPGDTGLVDLECQTAMDVAVGDRIIVRDQDLQRTLGGGLVLGTQAPQSRRRNPQRVQNLESLQSLVESDDANKALELACNSQCLNLDDFVKSWNLDADARRQLGNQASLREVKGRVLSRESLKPLAEQVDQTVQRHHQDHPQQFGPTLPQIASEFKLDRDTIQFVLACAVEDRRLVSRAGRYALTSHVVEAPTYNKQLYERIKPLIDVSQPPPIGDIAKATRIPFKQLEFEMKRMVAAKLIVQVSSRRYYNQQQLRILASLVERLASEGPFSVKQFRDASGIGRMIAIDVLEYFDRLRYTRRDENVRTVIGSIDRIENN